MSTVVQDLQRATTAINNIESKLISKGVIEQGVPVPIEDYPDRIDEIGGGGYEGSSTVNITKQSIEMQGTNPVFDSFSLNDPDNTKISVGNSMSIRDDNVDDYAGVHAYFQDIFKQIYINRSNIQRDPVTVQLEVTTGFYDSRSDRSNPIPARTDPQTSAIIPAVMDFNNCFFKDLIMQSKDKDDTSKLVLILNPAGFYTTVDGLCNLKNIFMGAGSTNSPTYYRDMPVDIILPYDDEKDIQIYESAKNMFCEANIRSVSFINSQGEIMPFYDGTLDTHITLEHNHHDPERYTVSTPYSIAIDLSNMFLDLKGIDELVAPTIRDIFNIDNGSFRISLKDCSNMYSTNSCKLITNLFIPTDAYGEYYKNGTMRNNKEMNSSTSILGDIINTEMRTNAIKTQLGGEPNPDYPLRFGNDSKYPFCDYAYDLVSEYATITEDKPDYRVLFMGDCCDEYIDHEIIDDVEYTGWVHYINHQEWVDNLVRCSSDKSGHLALPEVILLPGSTQQWDPAEDISYNGNTVSLETALTDLSIRIIHSTDELNEQVPDPEQAG